MAFIDGLFEFGLLSAAIGTSETTVAHGSTKAPDFVLAIPQNAAAHYVGQTKAADGTNVYLIADTATLTCKIVCGWFGGK